MDIGTARRRLVTGAAAGAAVGAVGLAPVAVAGEPHDRVVATTSSAAMRRLVGNDSVARPHVDALAAAVGGTLVAGGAFARVEQAGPRPRGTT